MWDKMAWERHARHHWHSDCCGETNYFTCLWWSKAMSWCQAWLSMRSMVTSCWSELLPLLHPGALIWILCPTRLIACTWMSWSDRTNKILMHSVYATLQACVGGRAHQLIEVHVQLQSDLLLLFTSMHAHNDMHTVTFSYIRSTTLLTLFAPCQLLGWIYNLYEHNFIHECMLRPLLYMFLLQLILSSMQLLFFLELQLQHMQLLLCSILYLRVIFLSHPHLISWVSKVSFITSGSSWACNFVPPLCCQQNSSCVCCIRYVAFNFFVDGVACCDGVAVVSWCPFLQTTRCLDGYASS